MKIQDNNPFEETVPTVLTSYSASKKGYNFRDGVPILVQNEIDNRNLRKCSNCGQDKKVVDFPRSFRKTKQCRFCVFLKRQGNFCMPSDMSLEKISSSQQQHTTETSSSHDKHSNHRGSLNISPTLTKSLRNLLSKSGAPLAPPIVTSIPNAQLV